MNFFKLLAVKILVISVVFLFAILVFFGYLLVEKFNLSQESVALATPQVSICGTQNIEEANPEGKQLFNSICSACHKLDSKMTGPALRDIDANVFRKWVDFRGNTIDTTKLKQLKLDFHWELAKKNLGADGLDKLLKYVHHANKLPLIVP